MSEKLRSAGWDKKAVNRIANEEYDGLPGMFDAHGWTTGGRIISQIASTKVVELYGSVDAFVRAHDKGIKGNAMLDPAAAIHGSPTEVWLTSYYDYEPQHFGMLGFTVEGDRDKFVRESRPGALVVIYGTKDLGKKKAGLILGVQQVSHVVGNGSKFSDPKHWAKKQESSPDNWNYAVACTRAWEIPLECRPTIDEFADTSYTRDYAQTIGRRGIRLQPHEARKLLDIGLIEIPVFGQGEIDETGIVPGRDTLKPSRPGPVSQNGHWAKEAEGPKHLYMLRLAGKVRGLVGERLAGRTIIKIGFSVSPITRRNAHNSALPGNRIKWKIHCSTFDMGRKPFASSKHALAGEHAMKELLATEGRSLGNEFFLADTDAIDRAWAAAISAAENWKG